MTDVNVVVDMQYGSTGKGALAYLLGEFLAPDVAVTAWGPNAGHSVVDSLGRRFIHTMLASSMLCHSVKTQLIGPGSVVNLSSLLAECQAAAAVVEYKTIVIHPAACILTKKHAESEQGLVRIGSTMKGTAAAVIDKMRRDAEQSPLARDLAHAEFEDWEARFRATGIDFVIDGRMYDNVLDTAHSILIEGAQGFSLGLHTRFWPHTTSRDVSVAQMMADCRVPHGLARGAVVWGTARTFPIRVANRFDARGEQVGTSGDCYSDQCELDWLKDLYRAPELTTVTKLPRRIFTFSGDQIYEAARVCSPSVIALTFSDYLEDRPPIDTLIGPQLTALTEKITARTGCPVRLLTFGPGIKDAVILDGRTVRWLNGGNFTKYVLGGK